MCRAVVGIKEVSCHLVAVLLGPTPSRSGPPSRKPDRPATSNSLKSGLGISTRRTAPTLTAAGHPHMTADIERPDTGSQQRLCSPRQRLSGIRTRRGENRRQHSSVTRPQCAVAVCSALLRIRVFGTVLRPIKALPTSRATNRSELFLGWVVLVGRSHS